jgi:hypothetical protein
MQVHFFTAPGQQRHEFVDYGSRGQSIMARHARVVYLLIVPLDPTEFLLECSRLISASQTTPIELLVVPPSDGTIPSFFIRDPRSTTLVSLCGVSFPGYLVSFTSKPCGSGYFSFDGSSNFLCSLFDAGSPHPPRRFLILHQSRTLTEGCRSDRLQWGNRSHIALS